MAVDVRELQRSLNRFTNKYLKGVEPLVVDGKKGHATNVRIMTVKYFLGYGEDRNAAVTDKFVRRMRHPRSREYSTRGLIRTGIRRRAAQKARWARTQVQSYLTPGVTRWQGKPVAKAAVYYLDQAKKRGWQGGLNSGWRDPLYSRQLCINMCGAPSCPGRCAGTASNHVGNSPARFAVDVSDYYRFGQIMREIPLPNGLPRIFNALGARDPVHFSPSGN
jgi:hypothetical protein